MPHLTLLGGAVLEDESDPISGPAGRRHPLALLALLATAPSRTRSRSKVAGLLWPDSPESAARSRLNTCLYRVRSGLGSEAIASAGDDLRLDPEVLRCDVVEFEDALEADEPERAADLYGGPFLDGFRLKGAPAFEKWMDRERGRLAERYRDALETLAERAEARGDAAAAARWWRERAREQPYDSRVVHRLMETLAAAGNPAEALQVARTHERLLEDELGTEPGAEVREAIERLEEGAVPSGTTPSERPPGNGVVEDGRDDGAAPAERDAETEGAGSGSHRDRRAIDREDPRSPTSWLPDRRVLPGLLVALLIAGGLAWLFTPGDRAGSEPPSDVTGGGETSVAVLPFQVSGEAADTWRDGMVTLLSTGLDGAAGVRAVPDRTVLAAWNGSTDRANTLEVERALAVAREVGARYAVVGSAVVVGDELRLSAAVQATGSGEQLDQVQVRGEPDSVATLADALAGRILGVLAERTGSRLQSADVASVTTRSLPALEAYLAGERHYRDGAFGDAIRDYRRAVARDSTFALAYWRLASALGWQESGRGAAARRRAHRLSDRLPRRERRLLRASWLFREEGQAMAAFDSLRRLTEDYPDEPEAWYQLGEVFFHGGVPGGWPEADRAFGRAVELNPGHAPYRIHHVALAVTVHHDRSLAAERAAGLRGSDVLEPWFPAAMDLAFGDAHRRRQALTRIDTVADPDEIPGSFLMASLLHPSDQVQAEAVGRTWPRHPIASALVVHNLLRRGRVRQATRFLPQAPPTPSVGCALAQALSLGYPLPDSVLRAHLEPDDMDPAPPLRRLLCVGVYLTDEHRPRDLKRVLDRVRRTATSDEKRESRSARARDVLDVVRGYRAWRSGELDRAERLLSRSVFAPARPWTSWRGLWRGDLYRELGDLETAEGWYLAAWWHPLAHERLGRLYETMGRPEEAATAYRRFAEAWAGADEPLKSRVERARNRIEALSSGN